ncbi:DUF1360 domain-containing protein [Pectobacterium sp. B1J-3]|uniref:DUF1360 domain-containing protein n=1 Tax=Pectobacterium sp. B1J-3 TaxID=3385371 RepID=UPI00390694D3
MEVIFESEFMNSVWMCVVIAVAASNISITITQTEIFSPLRNISKKIGHMAEHLFHCFYCMSHWIIAAGILIYQPRIIESNYFIVDLIVSWFFSISMATLFSGIIFKVFIAAMTSKIKETELKKVLAEE